MKRLTHYIESELEGFEYDKILLKFQRNLKEEGLELERRTKKAGLPDEGVIFDLFKSLHPDLKGEYEIFRKAELKKNAEKARHKFLLIASPIYFIVMTAVYLALSFHSGNWSQSWLLIIGFVTFFVDTVGTVTVMEIVSRRKLFHPIARVALGLTIMMNSVFIYLIGLILFRIPHFWVIFPAGVCVVLIADAVFAYCTKQILRNINYIIYVVAAFAMLYVILGGTHVIPWNPGWLMVPLSLIVDVIYVIIRLAHNRKYVYRPEEN